MRFRVHIDVANLQVRLSRTLGRSLGKAEVSAWLAGQGFERSPSRIAQEWIAGEQSLEALKPWEILDRFPMPICAEPAAECQQASMQAH